MKQFTIRILTFSIMLVLLILSNSTKTYAKLSEGEQAGENSTVSEAETIDDSVITIVDEEKDIQAENAQYHCEQEFSSDHYMRGLFDECTEYFSVGNWDVLEATLTIDYATTQMLNEQKSYYTIFVNSEPVYSAYFTGTKGKEGKIVVPLPAKAIKADQINSIKIETYIRGKLEDACVDDVATSAWVNVFNSSNVTLKYNCDHDCNTLSQFYEKITSIEAMDNKESMVCVGSEPDEGELTSYSYIVSGISQNAEKEYQNMEMQSISGIDEINKQYVVYIRKYEKVDQRIKQLLNTQQKECAEKEALVCVLHIGQSTILLVTGTNQGAIINAGRMIANSEYMSQLNLESKEVTETENYIMEEQSIDQYKDLTEYGVELKGLFKKSAQFSIEYPANRTLVKSSQLSLDFRYSQDLDFEKSLVTVYINEVPIGSRKLTEENADSCTELFDIPADLKITGTFTVDIVFDLQSKTEWCNVLPEDVPWAYISNTSKLKLASIDGTDFYFENYPSPFIRDGVLNKVGVALSESPTKTEVIALGRIMLTLGRFQTSNAGDIRVLCGADENELINYNIIAIGTAVNNDIVRNNPITDDIGYFEDVGKAQLFISPYSEAKYALMVMTGSDEKSILNSIKWISDTEEMWHVEGDLYITDGEELYCKYISKPEEETISPAVVKERKQATKTFVVIVVTVATLVLLATIMLVLKYRRVEEDEKEEK